MAATTWDEELGRPTPRRPRLVVAANRLAVRSTGPGHRRCWEPSPGGLVNALRPALRGRHGCWVGWSGCAGATPAPFGHDGILQVPISLSTREVSRFYEGFCNSTLWPLYHEVDQPPRFDPTWWEAYRDVNRRYARRVARLTSPVGLVWVHDYHLQEVPALLREAQAGTRIGFFLHVPFPPPEVLGRLPWHREILRGLLGSDLVGFQTARDLEHFAAAAGRYVDARPAGPTLLWRSRTVRVGVFPASIDVACYQRLAAAPTVRARAVALRRAWGDPARVVLGVDRLDYTKGIDRRLEALGELLDRRPALADDLVAVQVAVPSRERVPGYPELRGRVEALVERINRRHGRPGHLPVRYLYGSLGIEELVAHYLAADVAWVTPLRDGMNLVAKEYVATRLDGTGVLVLSERAGAAVELQDALLVDPDGRQGLARSLEMALQLPAPEARARMTSLRRAVLAWDAYRWAAEYLSLLEGVSGRGDALPARAG